VGPVTGEDPLIIKLVTVTADLIPGREVGRGAVRPARG